MRYQPVASFTKNDFGEDYVVGDIHGCFETLTALLKQIRFNPSVDRLFSCGDLVNRGPNSHQVLIWLRQPWFHAIMGNHENMIIAKFDTTQSRFVRHLNHLDSWLGQIESMDIINDIAVRFNNLPIAMEIATRNGLVGVVHGDIMHTHWGMFKGDLRTEGPDGPTTLRALWERSRHKTGHRIPVEGVQAVYCGHTVVEQPMSLGNVIFIDTGCVYGGQLTIANLNTHVTTALHRVDK